MNFYIDTCIYRDYLENRKDKFRPLGDWAFELFKLIINEKHILIYSDLNIAELKFSFSEKKVLEIFDIFPEKIKISITNNNLNEAKELSKKHSLNINDALHSVIARENKAILITRDKHFLELSKIVEIKKPEELI
ncbi:MAG: PIN domain-containing protein [Candidatus Woesearchaeota archaeon]